MGQITYLDKPIDSQGYPTVGSGWWYEAQFRPERRAGRDSLHWFNNHVGFTVVAVNKKEGQILLAGNGGPSAYLLSEDFKCDWFSIEWLKVHCRPGEGPWSGTLEYVARKISEGVPELVEFNRFDLDI